MTEFSSLKIVGGLLPADLLGRVFAGDSQVPGTSPATYGLERRESVRQQASRSWLYLLEIWQDFKQRIESAADGTSAPGSASARLTRERWLHILLRELGFHQMAGGSFELDGKSFPVSHRSGPVPIHLLGWATDLDHRTPHVTARAPQSMVQELLNRDDAVLWAILSNGAVLRLLRDSTALVGSAYVEFDLEAIFDGELFSDFVLLYLTCHGSRFAVPEEDGPESCYLEQWRGFAAEQGERALNQLRAGVQQAISLLGTGFLAHPANPQLRLRLGNGELKLDDLNRALLRLVYRMLFWFVAEDRGALLQPDPEDGGSQERARLREARDRYATYFSSERLRHLARRRRGSRHGDQYEAVRLVVDALGTEGGVPELALPGIGGIFESRRDDGRALPLDEPLAGARLSNEALLGAVRALSLVKPRDGGAWRRVNFGNLGAEELGSVYESLLELIPGYDEEQLAYTLETLPGNERKETGSYYTPTSLVECLLDSALDPLLDEACRHATAEERVAALLDLTVCDPACGSGHFLVAAARRIAKRIAAEETGESEPPDAAVRTALRRVVGRCIYGVDVNPMAAELAKVSLWLEALEPGKPLSYLDQNIRVGNSLLGVTPALLAEGLPDAAFSPIEGDDRKICTALKKQNAGERDYGERDLFSQVGIPVSNAVLAKRAVEIARALPDSLEDLHIHQQREALELAGSDERRLQKLLADAWCAAFVQPKTTATRPTAITHAVLERFAADAGTLDLAAAEELVGDLARQYRFFHWHVEFPHIFRVGNGTSGIAPATGWSGGFSCVIGNPPWERVKLQEQEFFASRRPDIANAANAAARKKMIAALKTSEKSSDHILREKFLSELRKASGESHLLRDSGRYPLTGQGDINTYAVFAETARIVISSMARLGIIVPTKIATDNTTRHFFRALVQSQSLASLFDFRYTSNFFKSIAIAQGNRFCLLTITSRPSSRMRLAFLCDSVAEAIDPNRQASLSLDDIALINPNTETCPTFQSNRDAQITIDIYKRVPVLWRDRPEENPWGVSFLRMYDMATDSNMFQTSEQLRGDGWVLQGNVYTKNGKRMLPLYEAKMVHHFDHRFGDYRDVKITPGKQVRRLPTPDTSAHKDPLFRVLPRYWVPEFDTPNEQRSKPGRPVFHLGVISRLEIRKWRRGWLFGWRDVASAVDERTVISSALPSVAVGHKFLLCFTDVAPELLLANLSSFILDYTARQKFAGTSMAYFVLKQLPVLPPDIYNESAGWLNGRPSGWISDRVLELSYTAWDMEGFARDLSDDQPPFRWEEERRALIRAELDAGYFHLYGLRRDAVEHVMDSFHVLRENEESVLGIYRTKQLILERYDAMAEAARTGEPYQTVLDPPPGQGPRHSARPDVRAE